ncbi:hypothetical protein C8Q70DRAFT_875866, partial [Cubamyces menziesii]
IKPSQEDVAGLLSRGRVPVVVLIGEELRVRHAQDVPYVAISHVWAERMGSTTEVGLPGCMVHRIAGLAQRLLPPDAPGAESAFWWMDSMCVPRAREQRKRAIGLMAQTYRGAARVLVVDDSIRAACSAARGGLDETLARIGVSRWMRRVWTLQEALLAHELWFEFRDGLVDVEEQLLAPLRLDSEASSFPARHEAPIFDAREKRRVARLALNSVLAGEGGDSEDTMMTMENIVQLLRGRRTTKPEDELVAIASLLPPMVRLEALLAVSDGPGLVERRMQVFLLQLRAVPRALPFCTSPRLEALPGFAWAPRLLVQDGESAMGTWDARAHGMGECVEDGLVAEYLFARCARPVEIPR